MGAFLGWNADGTPMRVPVSQVAHCHTPRKAGKRTDKWGRKPIDVYRRWFGGFRIIDGNDRLHYTRQDGQRHIIAQVWR